MFGNGVLQLRIICLFESRHEAAIWLQHTSWSTCFQLQYYKALNDYLESAKAVLMLPKVMFGYSDKNLEASIKWRSIMMDPQCQGRHVQLHGWWFYTLLSQLLWYGHHCKCYYDGNQIEFWWFGMAWKLLFFKKERGPTMIPVIWIEEEPTKMDQQHVNTRIK